MILVLGNAPSAPQLAHHLDGRHDAAFDPSSMRDVRRVIAEHHPSAVVWMQFDDDLEAAERDENRAYVANSEAVISLAAATMEFSATPVLISTPELFGQRGGPWSESDEPSPRSVWAESRRRGEVLLMRAAPKAIVLRVGPILSDDLSVERAALEAGVSTGPSRRVSPIGVEALAHVIRRVLTSDVKGVVHVAPDEAPVREHDMWTTIAEALGIPPTHVQHARDDRLAPNASMRVDRLEKILDGPLPSWRTVLDRASRSRPEPPKEAVSTPPAPAASGVWAKSERFAAAREALEKGDARSGEGAVALFVERGKIALTIEVDGEESDRILRAQESAQVSGVWSYVALAESVVFSVT